LKQINDERDVILESYRKERSELELKYKLIMKPVYDKRSNILNNKNNNNNLKSTIIPNFWLIAMNKDEMIGSMIEEDDCEALEYLKDIRCEDKDNLNGFVLEFHFAPNPYFF